MRAIILAAGEGKRLRPLTNNIPKCMVKLFGKSILEHQIMTLRSCGINDISVVTGYCKDHVDFPGIKYYHNENFDSTNMVETLFCAEEELEESVIISYGDIIFEKYVLEKLLDSKHESSIMIDKNWLKYWQIRFKNPLDDAESLSYDENNFLTDIGRKVENIDEISGQYIGLMKFQGNGLKFLKNFYHEFKSSSTEKYNPLNPNIEFKKSYMTDLLNGLCKKNVKLQAIFIENGWLELDTLDDFELYQKMQSSNALSIFYNINN
jgi:L-glutamine-phosphate cytidylyltransferase